VDPDRIAEGLRRGSTGLDIVDRAHADYDAARRVWNGIFERRPGAIVRARSRDDVAATVRFAREHDILLAVRGGGHSLPGLSTCDDGIVLDLSPMRSVHVDPERRRATVEGGALLGDLDRAGEPYGLVVPAGVVGHTGVGGLTLGGGMGRLSRRLGLTIDSLEGAELVLADGRVVDVSADTEPELFWAIRGGGGNFGVVTSFRFRMHELGDVVVGEYSYPRSSVTPVLGGFAAAAARAPRELAVSLVVTGNGVDISIMRSGPGAASTADVERFGRLGAPSSASSGPMSFVELQGAGDEAMRWGRRIYAKGGFVADLDDAVIAIIDEASTRAPTPDSEIYVIQLGSAVADVAEAETAYTGRAAEFYWIVEPVWDDPALDASCLAWGREVAGRLATHSLAGNYVNEQSDAGIAAAAYGATKLARLGSLKARFDPTNLFRLNQNVAPPRSDA
jgi:FAD/FMN-containing dehydrogenase